MFLYEKVYRLVLQASVDLNYTLGLYIFIWSHALLASGCLWFQRTVHKSTKIILPCLKIVVHLLLIYVFCLPVVWFLLRGLGGEIRIFSFCVINRQIVFFEIIVAINLILAIHFSTLCDLGESDINVTWAQSYILFFPANFFCLGCTTSAVYIFFQEIYLIFWYTHHRRLNDIARSFFKKYMIFFFTTVFFFMAVLFVYAAVSDTILTPEIVWKTGPAVWTVLRFFTLVCNLAWAGFLRHYSNLGFIAVFNHYVLTSVFHFSTALDRLDETINSARLLACLGFVVFLFLSLLASFYPRETFFAYASALFFASPILYQFNSVLSNKYVLILASIVYSFFFDWPFFVCTAIASAPYRSGLRFKF